MMSGTVDIISESELIIEPSWEMFEKISELGVGTFGVVYLVKCIKNSRLTSEENGNKKKAAGKS